MGDVPTHVALCRKEQEFFLKAIKKDLDFSDHIKGAIGTLNFLIE